MAQAIAQSVPNPFADLRLEDLRARTSAKWRLYGEDVLPLWVAEMDAVVAPCVVDAVMDALQRGDTGYPFGHAYADAIADFAAERWDWSFDPARTAQVVDVMTGILELTRVTSQDGEAIILTPPVYPPFFMVARTLDRPIHEAPLGEDGRLDADAIERAFREATAGGRGATMLLSNPHNPTGVVHTRAELETVARLARQYEVRVISDEIHSPLIMPTARYVPYLDVEGTGPDLAVMSASKGWNLAGFKAAVAIPGEEAGEAIGALATRAGNHPGHIGVIAHTTAFREGRPWLDAAIAGIDANRTAFGHLLAEHVPGAVYTPPEGTYLAWVDVRPLGFDDDPVPAMLETGKVAFSSGVPFGTNGAGHIRVNLATSPALLAEAVGRIARCAESRSA